MASQVVLISPDELRTELSQVRSTLSGYGGLDKLMDVQSRMNDHGLQEQIQEIITAKIDLIYKINRLIASIPSTISE